MLASPHSFDGRPGTGKTPANGVSARGGYSVPQEPTGEGEQHVWDHRIRRAPGVQAASASRPRAPRVPGLRLGRDRPARDRRARPHACGREPAEPEEAHGPERIAGDDGARSHALGHARRRHRGERSSARRRGRGEARDRPQRHRRELPRAARAPLGAGPCLLVRDRRRDGDAPDRGLLRGRPRRGGPSRLRGARGPLRVRRHPPRPPGHARRRAAAVPHGGGPRRG